MEINGYVINPNKIIGQGKNGIVYECTSEKFQNIQLCAKIVEFQGNIQVEQVKEIQIIQKIKELKNIQANHLIKVFDIFQKDQKFYIIMEKYSGGDMLQLLNTRQQMNFFSAKEILQFIVQFVNGYEILYKNNIMHRDIKPQNIFLNFYGQYVIGDLGAGKIVLDLLTKANHTNIGTPAYSSPEILLEQPFSCKTDVYSFGMVTYQMTFLKLPFLMNRVDLYNFTRQINTKPLKIAELNIQGTIEQNREIIFILENCLIFNEDYRLSWDDIFYRIKTLQVYKEFLNIFQYEQQYLVTELNKEIQFNEEVNLLISTRNVESSNKQFQQLQNVPIKVEQNQNPIKNFLKIQEVKLFVVINTLEFYIKLIQSNIIEIKFIDHLCYTSILLGYKYHLMENIIAIYEGNIQRISKHLLKEQNEQKVQLMLINLGNQTDNNTQKIYQACKNEIQQLSFLPEQFSYTIQYINQKKIKFIFYAEVNNFLKQVNQEVNYQEFWKYIEQIQSQFYLLYDKTSDVLSQLNEVLLIFLAYLKSLSEIIKKHEQLQIDNKLDFQGYIGFTKEEAIAYLKQK